MCVCGGGTTLGGNGRKRSMARDRTAVVSPCLMACACMAGMKRYSSHSVQCEATAPMTRSKEDQGMCIDGSLVQVLW